MSELPLKEQLLQEANAIPSKAIKRLGMPYDTFLQESKELVEWAKEDLEKLKMAGFQESILKECEAAIELAQELHTAWVNKSKSVLPSVEIWNNNKKEGVALGKKLLNDFKYAFRKDKNLLSKLSVVKFPCKKHEIMGHLDVLVLIGKENKDLLDIISFDFNHLSKAEVLSDKLLHSHAVMNTEILSANQKNERDKVFFLLKMKVQEIKECGKYVFKTNSDRLKGYLSNYVKRKNDKANRILNVANTAISVGINNWNEDK